MFILHYSPGVDTGHKLKKYIGLIMFSWNNYLNELDGYSQIIFVKNK